MKPPALLVDRDGTTASVAYIAPTDKDTGSWAAFNASLRFDAPVPVIIALLHAIRPDVTIIMTSGRMEGDWPGDRRRRFAMVDWLVKHSVPVDILIMRKGGDTRRDSIVKAEMFREQIEPHFDVKYVIDDRPQVVQAWRDLGLPVLQVVDPDILPPITGGVVP